ncbi:DUF3592 domain-containing protein [Kosakonia cowanii]|uniref:DUF3592 domain-containing protein n=1 Tax=Kosakonia cowanii TaxID=208223 RepID=UPI000FECCEC1|nr:hypothetical protein [Kosakonia cowanii]MDM9618670.1 hypothetical protein [Kosakonia cowanii]MDP4563710.1 hypothetical protein [Kosakonia cowanii]QAR46016.1 hypothetical protein EQG67_09705 [Kosakonia cowanii]
MAQFLFNSYFTTIIGIVIFCAGVIAYCYHTGTIYDKFKKEGARVEAKIISKEKIGASGTGNTKFRMIVEFPTEDGIVRATAKRFFTPEDLIKVMRNNTVILYYMPHAPQKILLMPNEME